MWKPKLFVFFLLACLVRQTMAQGPALVIIGVGAVGVLERDDEEGAAVGVEYRSPRSYLNLSPMAGFFVSADSSAYAYAGIYHDFKLGSRWVLSPHLSVGAYNEGGGNDLGGTFQFQPGIDLFYRLQSNARLGVTVRHLSNAGIHDKNPGTEVAMLLYAIPLGGR
jgi:lipid A 3-O-deacylase